MSDAFLIPLKVFGLGFIISMGMAVLIKFLLVAIQFFSRNSKESNE